MSDLVTSSVLRLSTSSCKSYADPYHVEDQLFTCGKAPKVVGKVKWPSFSDTEIKFQTQYYFK